VGRLSWTRDAALGHVLKVLERSGRWAWHASINLRVAASPPGFPRLVACDGERLVFAEVANRDQLTSCQRRWLRVLLDCNSVDWLCLQPRNGESKLNLLRRTLATLKNDDVMFYCPAVARLTLLAEDESTDGQVSRERDAFVDMVIVQPPTARFAVLGSGNGAERWLNAILNRPNIEVHVWEPGRLREIERILV
jgi:hypothetical protein